MSTWGRADFQELVRMRDKFQQLQSGELEKLAIDLTNEIAARLFRKIVKRTPVGQYPSSSGKVGGTLKGAWTIGTLTKTGNMYQIEIINPNMYAPYVEFGHRTRDHKGWVKGRFMLTISEKEIEQQVPKIIERRITEYLRWCLNGQ